MVSAPIVNQLATIAGFIATSIAIGGFLGHTGPAFRRLSERWCNVLSAQEAHMTELRALALIFIAMMALTSALVVLLLSLEVQAEFIALALIAILGATTYATSSVVMHYGAKRRQR